MPSAPIQKQMAPSTTLINWLGAIAEGSEALANSSYDTHYRAVINRVKFHVYSFNSFEEAQGKAPSRERRCTQKTLLYSVGFLRPNKIKV